VITPREIVIDMQTKNFKATNADWNVTKRPKLLHYFESVIRPVMENAYVSFGIPVWQMNKQVYWNQFNGEQSSWSLAMPVNKYKVQLTSFCHLPNADTNWPSGSTTVCRNHLFTP